jgi:glycosyltransferase involved in cell wall biosynthesis
MSLPNVLHVLPALESGGVELHVAEVLENFAKLYPNDTFFVASAGGKIVNDILKYYSNIKHFTVPLNTKSPVKIFENAVVLKHIMQEHEIDIVHAHSRAPAWSCFKAAKETESIFVTTYHGTYNCGNYFKKIYNKIMVMSDYTIAISDFIKNHIHAVYGAVKSNIVTIHEGIDSEIFNPSMVTEHMRQTQRQEWNIDFYKKIILIPGRLTRWKGQLILTRAVGNLDEKKDCVVVFLGSAQGRLSYQSEIEKLCHDLNVDYRMISNCKDMKTAYAVADVVVSASTDPEAFGRVTAEAIAMNRQVIATNHGGSIELTKNGQHGILVAPGDVGALTNALDHVLSSSVSHKNSQGAGRNHILETYDLTTMIYAMADFYRKIHNEKNTGN